MYKLNAGGELMRSHRKHGVVVFAVTLLLYLLTAPALTLAYSSGSGSATVSGNLVSVTAAITSGMYYEMEYCAQYGTSIAFAKNDSVHIYGTWGTTSGLSGNFTPNETQSPVNQYCPDGLQFQNGAWSIVFSFYDYTPGNHKVSIPWYWSGDRSASEDLELSYSIP